MLGGGGRVTYAYTLYKIVGIKKLRGGHDRFNWRPGIKLDNNWRGGAPRGRHGPLHFSVIRRHPSMMMLSVRPFHI